MSAENATPLTSSRVREWHPAWMGIVLGTGGVSLLALQGAQILYVTATDDLAGIVNLDQSKEKAAVALDEESHRAMEVLVTI